MISLIIPTTPKNKAYLDLCVKSFKETTPFDYEIIIAENGEGTNEVQGQCRAVNKAAQKARGDWIMVTNDDMYYAPLWHVGIVKCHDVFSPNLVEPTDNAGSAPPFMKVDGGLMIDDFKQNVVDKFVEDHRQTEVENGFNLPFIIRRELWDLIGGYDEMYDPWGSNSDSDLQYKLELCGITPKRFRGALVYHFGNKSGTFESDKQAYWQSNWDYFVDKWGFDREDTVWYHDLHIPLGKLKYSPDWSIYR